MLFALQCFNTGLMLKSKPVFAGKDLVSFILDFPDFYISKTRSEIVEMLKVELANPNHQNACILPYNCSKQSFDDSSIRFVLLGGYVKISKTKLNVLNTLMFNNLFGDDLPAVYHLKHNNFDLVDDSAGFVQKLNVIISQVFTTGLKSTNNPHYPLVFNNNSAAVNRYYQLINYLPFMRIRALMTDSDLRKSFFINLYNSMSLHMDTHLYEGLKANEPKLVLEKKVRTQSYYNIAGSNYSLDNIRTDVLGCSTKRKAQNKKTRCFLASLFLKRNNTDFLFQDHLRERLRHKGPSDPRVYFCFVEKQVQASDLAVFTAVKLESQLDDATARFNRNIQIRETRVSSEDFVASKALEKDFDTQPLVLLALMHDQLREPLKAEVKKVIDGGASVKLHWDE